MATLGYGGDYHLCNACRLRHVIRYGYAAGVPCSIYAQYVVCNHRLRVIDCTLGWSFFRKAPELPKSVSHTQKSIAKLTHGAIYLVMFVVFVSGFLMLKHEYPFFWLFTIPNPISNAEVNAFFFMVHRFGCATPRELGVATCVSSVETSLCE